MNNSSVEIKTKKYLFAQLFIPMTTLLFLLSCGGGGGDETGACYVLQGTIGASCSNLTSGQCDLLNGTWYAGRTCPSNSDDNSDSEPDLEPPSIPTISAEAISYNQVDISWDYVDDASKYILFRNGEEYPLEYDSFTSFSDTPTIIGNSDYCYSVIACDYSDNCSDMSEEVCVQTPSNSNLKWSFNSECFLNNLNISSGGRVFASCSDNTNNNTLYAINKDGVLEWKYSNINAKDIRQIGNDDTIYVRSSDNISLLAIGNNGELKWIYSNGDLNISSFLLNKDKSIIYLGSGDSIISVDTEGQDNLFYTGLNNAHVVSIGNDAIIYVKSENDSILNAIDSNGQLKWNYIIGETDCYLSFCENGTTYILKSPENLIALKSDGSEKWKLSLSDITTFQPDDFDKFIITSKDDGSVYLSLGRKFLKLNTDGDVLVNSPSKYSLAGSYYYKPLFHTDGFNYNGCGGSLFESCDGFEYCSLPWTYATYGITALSNYLQNVYENSFSKSDLTISPEILEEKDSSHPGDGIIYATFAGTILAIDTFYGDLSWSFTADSFIVSKPVLSNDGTVYIGSSDNKLHALLH